MHSKVLSKRLIRAFGLPIGLKMKATRSSSRDSQQLHDSLPEVAEEFGVSITDDGMREAVTTDDVVYEESGCVYGLLTFVRGHEVYHFGCWIRQNLYGIISSYLWGPRR